MIPPRVARAALVYGVPVVAGVAVGLWLGAALRGHLGGGTTAAESRRVQDEQRITDAGGNVARIADRAELSAVLLGERARTARAERALEALRAELERVRAAVPGRERTVETGTFDAGVVTIPVEPDAAGDCPDPIIRASGAWGRELTRAGAEYVAGVALLEQLDAAGETVRHWALPWEAEVLRAAPPRVLLSLEVRGGLEVRDGLELGAVLEATAYGPALRGSRWRPYAEGSLRPDGWAVEAGVAYRFDLAR